MTCKTEKVKPKIKETLLDRKEVEYCVQTTFPDSSRPETEHKFGSFYSWAYVHKDTPTKLLVRTHPELFKNRSRTGADGCRFSDYESAVALCEFLRENGRLECGWDSKTQEKYQKQRRGPLSARIVVRSKRETEHLLDF